MKLPSKVFYLGMKLYVYLSYISRVQLPILTRYLQQNIRKLHEPVGHQVGTKPETASVGKIHHCLGDGK